MTKKLYSHWHDVPVHTWHWPSFSPEEIACRGTGEILVDTEALDKLQALRNKLGRPMILNSAYRSLKHNRAVGGATASKHMEGIAFDCRMENHNPQEYMAAARSVGFNGIGEYPTLGFCHIDARKTPANWTGSAGKRFPKDAPAQFAAEPIAKPKTDAAKQAGVATAALLASEATLRDVLSNAPSFPIEWVTYVSIAIGVVVLARIFVTMMYRDGD
jgi:zinc D-Ala-D-Ala carboxypeptidase